MRRHVFHGPAWTNRRSFPIRGREIGKELEQRRPLPRKEGEGFDPGERGELTPLIPDATRFLGTQPLGAGRSWQGRRLHRPHRLSSHPAVYLQTSLTHDSRLTTDSSRLTTDHCHLRRTPRLSECRPVETEASR